MSWSSVNPSSATQGVTPATWSGASRKAGGAGAVGRMKSAITDVAALLKMQPADLARRLGSGQSLASVAESRGVSRQSLLDTVTKAVSSAVPQGSAPLSGDLLAQVSARIADSTSVPSGFSVRTQA